MAPHIKLVMLVSDVSLRGLTAREMKAGSDGVPAKPFTGFFPVAVTPDELGAARLDGRVHLRLQIQRSGVWFRYAKGKEMTFDFFRWIEHAAHSRCLRAATIIGSGTVSNSVRGAGSACIAERRAIETMDRSGAKTAFWRSGERVYSEMLDTANRTIFCAIDQGYVKHGVWA